MNARQPIRLTARGELVFGILSGILAMVIVPLGFTVIASGFMR